MSPPLKDVCKRGHDRTLPGALLAKRVCRECHRLAVKKYQVSDAGYNVMRKAVRDYRARKKGAT
jgi:hypothetical protein